MRIDGIGLKAIEELKAGLSERDLLHLIEDDLNASSDDMSQLLDMVFSPDDTILIGGDEPPTFNTEGEDMLGESLPPRSYRRDFEELDKLFGSQGSGFSFASDGFDDLLGGPADSDEE
jgi:DNA-directed RNA polymerase subunit beta'